MVNIIIQEFNIADYITIIASFSNTRSNFFVDCLLVMSGTRIKQALIDGSNIVNVGTYDEYFDDPYYALAVDTTVSPVAIHALASTYSAGWSNFFFILCIYFILFSL